MEQTEPKKIELEEIESGGMKSEEIKRKEKEYIMQSYARADFVIAKGNGCYLYDFAGRKYLDFVGGLGCISIGHSNKIWTNAIAKQARTLVHTSNLYYTRPQAILAEKLAGLSGLKKCFFCNSGSEANEAAIKLAKKITGKKKFIACKNAFHGRTHGSLSATWKEGYRKPFVPLVEGFTFVEYNEPEAIESAIDPDTAGIIIEPIQGESGVIVPNESYLKEVSEICRKKEVLLILDEVQTGNGRTGKYFAYQHADSTSSAGSSAGIIPDIVTTAKSIANGFPLGVCISNYEFEKGNHASTFGGNPLACAAANATIDYVLKNKLMNNAAEVGDYFMKKLALLNGIKLVRGKGLMIGAVVNANIDAKKIVERCLKSGLVINSTDNSTLRFLPPLIITKKEVDKALNILEEVLDKYSFPFSVSSFSLQQTKK